MSVPIDNRTAPSDCRLALRYRYIEQATTPSVSSIQLAGVTVLANDHVVVRLVQSAAACLSVLCVFA